jgi:hypothetical protein
LNLFLYRLAVEKLANEDIKIKKHNDKEFGLGSSKARQAHGFIGIDS